MAVAKFKTVKNLRYRRKHIQIFMDDSFKASSYVQYHLFVDGSKIQTMRKSDRCPTAVDSLLTSYMMDVDCAQENRKGEPVSARERRARKLTSQTEQGENYNLFYEERK